MKSVQLLWVVFALALTNSVQSKNICDFQDVECLTKGLQNVYRSIVDGIKNIIEPLDPLHLDWIDGQMESAKYHFTNIKLSGLGKCHINQVIVNKAVSSFDYDLTCPHLVLNYNYEIKGLFGGVDLDSKGSSLINCIDYVIQLKGKYGKKISEEDQKVYLFIDNYEIETDPKGGVVLEVKYHDDQDKVKTSPAVAYLNRNWRKMEKQYLSSPIMEKFMAKYVERLNVYLNITQLEEIFPKED